MKAWLQLLRIVNFPTVPGDVLVGASIAVALGAKAPSYIELLCVCLLSCFLYAYGLIDNDLIGVASDANRPLSTGKIQIRHASFARTAFLFLALCTQFFIASSAALITLALVVFILLYNRTKSPLAMGFCRALNVALGISCVIGTINHFSCSTILLLSLGPLIWCVFIEEVTRYSFGEEFNEKKRARVGKLIGALIYLQLIVLLLCYIFSPTPFSRLTLVLGAILLIALRLIKRACPNVSAS